MQIRSKVSIAYCFIWQLSDNNLFISFTICYPFPFLWRLCRPFYTGEGHASPRGSEHNLIFEPWDNEQILSNVFLAWVIRGTINVDLLLCPVIEYKVRNWLKATWTHSNVRTSFVIEIQAKLVTVPTDFWCSTWYVSGGENSKKNEVKVNRRQEENCSISTCHKTEEKTRGRVVVVCIAAGVYSYSYTLCWKFFQTIN